MDFFFYVGAFRQADHKRRCIKLGSMCRKATEKYVESCSHSDLMDIMQHFLSETEMDDSWSITYLGLHATLQLGHKYRQLRHKVSGRRLIRSVTMISHLAFLCKDIPCIVCEGTPERPYLTRILYQSQHQRLKGTR